jgi:hypothetical protein
MEPPVVAASSGEPERTLPLIWAVVPPPGNSVPDGAAGDFDPPHAAVNTIATVTAIARRV